MNTHISCEKTCCQLQYFLPIGSTKKKLRQHGGLLLHYWAMVGTVNCSGDRQLHICFLQYLYTFDLLVLCSMLQSV